MSTYRNVKVQLTDSFRQSDLTPIWPEDIDYDVSRPVVEKVVDALALATVLDGLPGNVPVAVRAAAIDVYGNQSDWSNVLSATTTKDTTTPAPTSGLNVVGGFRGAAASWAQADIADLAYYELAYGTDPGFPEVGTSTIRTKSTAVWVTGLTPESNPGDEDVIYYFRVRTVDTSTNAGDWSGAPGTGTAEADDNVVTVVAHNFAVDDRVYVSGLVGGTGLSTGLYFVKTAPTADTLTLSATEGGATVDITVDYSTIVLTHLEWAVATQVGAADIAANSVTAAHITTSGLTADLIKAGTLRLTPESGSISGALAIEVYTSTGVLVGSWSPDGGLIVKDSADTSDYAHLDDGYLRFYQNNILTAEIGPQGILASSITYGTQPGGQNLVKNGSFEIGPYSDSLDATVTFTDTTKWKAADGTQGRVTALVNITEGTTLAPTSVAF